MQADELRAVRTIVAHADCPDGIASALILRAALPERRVLFVEHATPELTNLEPEPGMLFCDIAPPADRAQDFVAVNTIVLDHHRAARDVVAAFEDRGVFADEDAEPGVSGAPLAYREVFRPLCGENTEVARFAELAGIRDTWQRQHPDWEAACAQATALVFFGYDAFDGPRLTSTQRAVGERLVAEQREKVHETADRKLFDLGGGVRIYNDRDRLLSDVAQRAFDRDPSIRLVCGFHHKPTSDGKLLLVFAMRGNGLDVSAIAKTHGGGGHRSAAGFSVAVTPESDNVLTTFAHLLPSDLGIDGHWRA